MGDVSGSAEIRTPLLGPALLALALVVGATVAKLVIRSRRLVVQGLSMAPALLPGDRLVVVAAGRPRIGDVIAVPDPRYPDRILVKRVVGVDPADSTLMVAGDNADASTGSATFGPVARPTVLGRAVYCYFPRERAGRIRRWPIHAEPAPPELLQARGFNPPRR
jgi:nickel-type superoxide dismutase maturation protease